MYAGSFSNNLYFVCFAGTHVSKRVHYETINMFIHINVYAKRYAIPDIYRHICSAKHAHMQQSLHGSKLWVYGLVYRQIGCHSLTIVIVCFVFFFFHFCFLFDGTWYIDADGVLLSHCIIENIMIPLYHIYWHQTRMLAVITVIHGTGVKTR